MERRIRTTDEIAADTGRRRGTASLCALALTGLGAVLLLTARIDALVREGLTAPRVDRVVELTVAGVGVAAATWMTLSALLALACVAVTRAGRRWRAGEAALARLAPRAVRRMARAAVGVGVGAGLALVPVAAHAAQDGDMLPAPAAAAPLDLGWQPTAAQDAVPGPADVAVAELAPVDARPTSVRSALAATPASDDGRRAVVVADDGTVVVHRGDTLWDIAAAALGEGATDAEILRAVVQWHHANRDVVGDDPDLIRPGQVLRAPA